jgi:hypothetical protein
MADAKGVRAGKAYVEIGADKSPLARTLKAAGAQLKNWGASLAGIGAAITGPMLLLGGLAATQARELTLLSDQTGLSVEAVQSLGFAAARTGSDTETLVTGVAHMNRLIAEAAEGSAQANTRLAQLGITIEDLSGLSEGDRFRLIADRLSQISDRGQMAGTAMEIFGRGARPLVPLLAQGAEGIRQLEQRAREMGRVMSGEDVQSAAAFYRELNALAGAFKTAAELIAGGLVPGLREAFGADQDLAAMIIATARATRNWLQDNAGLISLLFRIGLGVTAAGAALTGLGFILPQLTLAWRILAATVGIFNLMLGLASTPVVIFIAAAIALAAAWVLVLDMFGLLIPTVEAFGEVWQVVAAEFTDAWEGIVDAVQAGDLGQAFRVLSAVIRVEWVRLTGTIENLWAGISTFLTNTFRTWTSEFGIFIGRAIGGLRILWARITNLTDAGFEEARQRIVAEIEQDVENIRSNVAEDNRVANDQLQATIQANEERFQAARAEFDVERETAARQHRERQERDRQPFDEKMTPLLTTMVTQAQQPGSFFADALRGLSGAGGQTPMEELHREQQQTNALLERVLRELQVGGGFA